MVEVVSHVIHLVYDADVVEEEEEEEEGGAWDRRVARVRLFCLLASSTRVHRGPLGIPSTPLPHPCTLVLTSCVV